MNLYDISKELNELMNRIPENPTPEEVEQLQQEYLKLDWSFNDKIENTIKYIKNLEANINAIEFEVERLEKKKWPIKDKITRLKDYIDSAMNIAWYDKLTTPIAKLSYTGGESFDLVDEDKIPKKFITIKTTTTTTYSKNELKKELKKFNNRESEWWKIIVSKNLHIK